MASKWDSLKLQLFHSLSREFAPHGFKPKVSESYIGRQTSYGYDRIGFSFMTYPGECVDMTPHIGIRHDAVMNLVNPHTFAWTEKDKKTNVTVGTRVNNILHDDLLCRWSLRNETDVQLAVDGMMSLYQTLGLQYFERFRHLEEVLTVCSARDQKVAFHCGSSVRPALALATSFLIHDLSQYCNVFADTKDYIESVAIFGPSSKRTFYAVAADLEQRWKAKESGAGNLSTGTI